MSTRVRSAIMACLGIIMCWFFLAPAIAGGIGVAPTRLELEQAMRGGEYDRSILVLNPGEQASAYGLSSSGDAGEWITFYEDAVSTSPINLVTVPAEGRTTLVARVSVPEDAASGRYSARITVASVPPDLAQAEAGEGLSGGAAVSVQAGIAVDIEVTGTQILAGVVEGITADDTEINYPLRINVHFRNTGNVIANPGISVALSRDGVLIADYSFTDTRIKPDSQASIPVESQTSELTAGEVVAKVTVSLNGEVLAVEDLTLQLLPVGSLTRAGQLVSLSTEGEPVLGRILKILTTFANTGQIESPARFVGEVYRDGVLIEAIESQELLVLPKKRVVLASYANMEQAGAYTIRGQINFGGRVTGLEELSFHVAAPQIELAQPGAAQPSGWIMSRGALLPLGLAAVIIALVGTAATLGFDRRGRVRRTS